MQHKNCKMKYIMYEHCTTKEEEKREYYTLSDTSVLRINCLIALGTSYLGNLCSQKASFGRFIYFNQLMMFVYINRILRNY